MRISRYRCSFYGGLHARWVIFFENLSDTDWVRTGLHPDIGVVSLEDQLRSYAAHGEGQAHRTDPAHPAKKIPF